MDDQRVEPDPGHDRELLAVHVADVELAALALERRLDRAVDLLRDAEVRGEQVRGAGRHDRQRRVGSGEDVDAALDHAVAAPDEDQLRALVERRPDLLGSLAALVHLDPERIGHAVALEGLP